MTTITARFAGKSTESFVAFVRLDQSREIRVSRDPAGRRGSLTWKCSTHGRMTGANCVHADVVEAANELRRTTDGI